MIYDDEFFLFFEKFFLFREMAVCTVSSLGRNDPRPASNPLSISDLSRFKGSFNRHKHHHHINNCQKLTKTPINTMILSRLNAKMIVGAILWHIFPF